MTNVSTLDLIVLVVTGVILPILLYILYDRSEKKGDKKVPRQRVPKKFLEPDWLSKGCFYDLVGMGLIFLLGLVVWGGIVCVILFL